MVHQKMPKLKEEPLAKKVVKVASRLLDVLVMDCCHTKKWIREV